MPDFIHNFTPGRSVVNGEPVERPSYDVTVVWAKEAREFFGCENQAELVRHVRGLDRLGLLLRNPESGLLSLKVRTGAVHRNGYAIKRRAYVLLCEPDEVPRRRRAVKRDRQRVYTW